jgi:hypothetical protein
MSHQRALELIPWLVNGSLRDDERSVLEHHVNGCLPCRAELKQQRALAALVARQRDAHLSPAAGFDALMRRADARVVPLFSRHLAIAASVAIALLGGAALLVYLPNDPAEPAFSTLAREGDGARLDIVFAANVTEAQMRAIVRDIGGSIVAGPSDVGRYTVELTAPEASHETVERLLASLRDDARIRFAGRSFVPVETR